MADQNEASQALRDALEQNGGLRQDEPVDPDRLERIRAEETTPGANSPASGGFGDLIAQRSSLEFVPVPLVGSDYPDAMLAARDELGRADFDLQLEDDFIAATIAVEHHHTLAQPVFDFDFA